MSAFWKGTKACVAAEFNEKVPASCTDAQKTHCVNVTTGGGRVHDCLAMALHANSSHKCVKAMAGETVASKAA